MHNRYRGGIAVIISFFLIIEAFTFRVYNYSNIFTGTQYCTVLYCTVTRYCLYCCTHKHALGTGLAD